MVAGVMSQLDGGWMGVGLSFASGSSRLLGLLGGRRWEKNEE